jgi:prepilin peptidase CpaA
MTLHSGILCLFPALMIFAAVSDVFTLTISNRVTAALALAFFPAALYIGVAPLTIALHASCGAAMLAVAVALFARGWIGGGDAKLFAAASLWLGWENIFDFSLGTTLLGGGLTVALLLWRAFPLTAPYPAWLLRLHDRREGVPYGIALSAAGVFIYSNSVYIAGNIVAY